MKAGELINKLKQLPQDDEVYFEYSTKNYWNDVLAIPLVGVDEVWVKKDDYHRGKLKYSDDGETKVTVLTC